MGLKVCQLCAVDFTLRHFLLPLIDGMEARGWQVTAVCSDGEYVADMRRQGYRIATVPIRRSFNVLAHVHSLWGLYRFFRRERFDVLHAHTPIAALIGRIAARLAGVPLVVYTAHGFYFHDEMPGWKRRLFIALERLGGRFTDLLFTQSREDAEAAVVERIAPADRVLEIGNGVDATRFDPASVADPVAIRSALGIPADAFVVGIIGRMVREKGYVELLEAAKLLAAAHPHVCYLLIGGRLASDHDDPVQPALDEARRALGDRLVAAGFRSDAPEMLAAMDVFCLPSYREGMPRTIIEAMMVGKAVVATNIRGAREEVVDGVTGLLVPTRDAAALAAALEQLIDDPGRAAVMGAAGRLRALELYDEKRVVELQLVRIAGQAAQLGLVR